MQDLIALKQVIPRIARCLCVLLLTSMTATAQGIPYRLEPASRLWLEGTATIGGYTCATSVVTGEGTVDTTGLEGTGKSGRSAPSGDVQLSVLVRMLDCGNAAMNNDMYAALKADKHRSIRFDVQSAHVTSDSAADGISRVIARGLLTIAGVSRETEVNLFVRPLPGGRFDIEGKKELSMREFGVEPPTAFFGLIRADEKLEVRFSLVAAPQTPMGAEHDYSSGSRP